MKDIQNQINQLQFGPLWENKKEQEIKELKEQNEVKLQEIYSLQKEALTKQKKFIEIEQKYEVLVKEKDKEIENAKNDLVITKDLVREYNHDLRQKDKIIVQ